MTHPAKSLLIAQIAGSQSTDRINGLTRLHKELLHNPNLLSEEEISNVFYCMVNFSPQKPTEAILYERIARSINNAGLLSAMPIEKMVDSGNITALRVISNIIDLLDYSKQEYIGRHARTLLLSHNPGDLQLDILMTLFKRLDQRIIVQSLKNDLDHLDKKILIPLTLLAEFGDSTISDKFSTILSNITISIDYEGNQDTILNLVWNYYSRFPKEISYSQINEVILFYYSTKTFNEHLTDCLKSKAKYCVNDLFQIIDAFYDNENVIGNVMRVMAQLDDLDELDFERLLTIAHPRPDHFITEWWMKDIASKIDSRYEPNLEKLYHGHAVEYRFSKQVLMNRGKKLGELQLDNPVIEIIDYFYNDLISNPENKYTFESMIMDVNNHRRKINRPDLFEISVMNLFSSLGFESIFLDLFGAEGFDIIAYSRRYDAAYLIGCTTGAIKENDLTVGYYASKAINSLNITEILPVICTNCSWDEAIRTTESAENGILVLTLDEITKLKELALDHRPHKEAILFLDELLMKQKPPTQLSTRYPI